MEMQSQSNEAFRSSAPNRQESDKCPEPGAVPGTDTTVSTPRALHKGDRLKWKNLFFVSVNASPCGPTGIEIDRKNTAGNLPASPEAQGKNLS